MPQVEYDTPELLQLLDVGLSVSELKTQIPMMGVDLGHVDEHTINVEVFPNRPDLLSIEGFARALRGYLGVDVGAKEYEVKKGGLRVFIEEVLNRPHISCAAVRNLVLTEQSLISLMDVQEKLHTTHGRNRRKVAIGVHDLDKIKAPFTYKAVDPKKVSFTPLEGESPLNLDQILRKHPKGADYAHLLEGTKKYPIIVDSQDNVLSFPPIINGEKSKVTSDTSNLFIESTGLSQKAVNQAVNIITTSLIERGGLVEQVDVIKKV